MWFETLTGFREESPEQVRDNLIVDGETITSTVNQRRLQCGTLETPTLADLRKRADKVASPGSLQLSEVVADVQQLHQQPENAGAMFQVASQFNLLEMVGPNVTPEEGVGIYEYDRTQGPACAIACGAGTIFRNYFVPVQGQPGQAVNRQIDCLYDLGTALGNESENLWTMRNGYALATAAGLKQISSTLQQANEAERDRLRSLLRIGIQWNVGVTLGTADHTVTQVYGSALPVAYSSLSAGLWQDFAQLVLEASYEAALCAALLNRIQTGNNRVFLTLLGGGAFGNDEAWIIAAIRRAIQRLIQTDLNVAIVSYGRSKSQVQQLIASL